MSANACDYPGVRGRLFLVTGASSGIGRACSLLLARLGAVVALNGRNLEQLQTTHEQMAGHGHLLAPGDLLALDFLPWLQELCERANMPLGGIAHCAGNNRISPLRAFSPEKLQGEFIEHSVATARLFHAAARLESREAKCSLVVMSSVSAREAYPAYAFYGAARAAMDSLCRSFAVECAHLGIRCNSVCGGFMAGTKMADKFLTLGGSQFMEKVEAHYPLGPGKPGDAASAIVFLLGSASEWITGIQLLVDGGYSARGI